jgi:hypothetical protein
LASPFSGTHSSLGLSTQWSPASQGTSALHIVGSGHALPSTIHLPASHRVVGQLNDPSAQVSHTAGSAGQSASSLHSPVVASGRHTLGQSVCGPLGHG